MKISNVIGNKITKAVKIRKYEREQKFLNKFCKINNDVEGDTFTQLNSARKTIANYAKNKGVTVEIADAEKKVAKETFEFDVDERLAKRAAKDKLAITVTPLKREGNTVSLTNYVPKDTRETHLHTVNDYFVVEYPYDDIQQTRLTKHEYEDNFLRNVYRKIQTLVDTLDKEKAVNKKK